MTIEVSHLVVNGCSYTYCQGLEAPWVQGWPALLAKKLGVPIVNLAVGGSGNDSIHRRTYEYYYKNKSLIGKPLYIIAFSHATRREEFFKSYKGKEVEEYMGLDTSKSSIDLVGSLSSSKKQIEDFEFAHIMNLSYEACERKKFLFWNSVVNLFKANSIPYAVGDYMPSCSIPVHEYMMEHYREIYGEALLNKNSIGDITKITKHFKKLECGHEPIDAMPLICDTFYNKLIEIYGQIVPVTEVDGQPINFLNLKEFYSQSVQKLMPWNLWLQNS